MIKPNHLVGGQSRTKWPRGNKKSIVHTVENKFQDKRLQTMLWPLRLSTQRKEISYRRPSHGSTAEIPPLKKKKKKKLSPWLDRNKFSSVPIWNEKTHPSTDQYSAIIMYWTDNTFISVVQPVWINIMKRFNFQKVSLFLSIYPSVLQKHALNVKSI